MQRNRADQTEYLVALLCVISVAGLVLLYFVLSGSELTYQETTRALIEEMVPSAIVALLAFPLLLVLLKRKGIFDHPAGLAESEETHKGRSEVKRSTSEYGWSGTISWEEACNAVGRLSSRIMNDGYQFDCIVSLTDGGLIVADLLLFHRKFRAQEDLRTPVVCMNLVRHLEQTKVVEVFAESYPIEYAKQFNRLLIVDEASRSGKTMDAVVSALKALYENHGLPLPSFKIATLGALVGGGPRTDYSELRLLSEQTYPWGPFAEHWRVDH